MEKSSAELLILSLVEARPRHGYEISKLIEQRSGGSVRFHVASLYPLLYRLERRGWLSGRWVEKNGQRRRRYYRLTRQGRKVLASQLAGICSRHQSHHRGGKCLTGSQKFYAALLR